MARVVHIADVKRDYLLQEDNQLSVPQRRAYRAVWALWNVTWVTLTLLGVWVVCWTASYFYHSFQAMHAFARDPMITRRNARIQVEFDPCLLHHADDVLDFTLHSGMYASTNSSQSYFYAARPKDITRLQASGHVYLGKLSSNRLDLDLHQLTGGKERDVTGITLQASCPLYGQGFFHVYYFKNEADRPYRFF